ncbi:daptide biosynthesis RiPP recognition protein [Streptomyces sp. NPDC006512]|uniref:daptide biosynthesis RiPP recognition protein n=1 Tax=Streptomyces sp. NPDC006512 TaxID=3154307 RepID=UPI0033BF9362
METQARRRAKEHIMSWGSGGARPAGVPTGSVATIVLADRAHLAALTASGLVGPGTLVFAPGSADGDEAAQVVGYEGSLAEPGADFALGEDFYLQTQDYASSAYMSVLGPTLVRVFGTEDFAAFCADADRAFAQGVFPEFLITPSVVIADLAALGAAGQEDGPGLRLYVGPDGSVSTSPGGTPLGTVGETPEVLATRFEHVNAASEVPCAVSLGAVVPEEARTAALQVRPFLARYLAAVRALRTLTAQDIGGLKVSGFGARLTPGLSAAGHESDLLDAGLPLVLFTPDQAYAVHSGRVFTIGHTTARALEALLAAQDAAEDFAAPAVLDRVRTFFADRGIRLDARIPAGVR